MGADAAVRIALRYGLGIAGIACVSGQYDCVTELSGLCQHDAQEQIARLPMRSFHAEADTYVKPEGCKGFMKRLGQELGGGVPHTKTVTLGVPPPADEEKDHDDWKVRPRDQGDLTMEGLELVPVDITTYAGTAKEMWLFPARGHSFARHTIWGGVFRNEKQFGLWKWLLSHRNSGARLARGQAFFVSLPVVSMCCSSEKCPVKKLGLCWGCPDGADVPVVGSDYERMAGSLLQEWNDSQMALGRHDHMVRPGDKIISVNGCRDCDVEPALRQLGSYTSSQVELGVLRTCGLEGGHGSTYSMAARKRLQAECEVQRLRRRGDFRWVIADHCIQSEKDRFIVCNVNDLNLNADQLDCWSRNEQLSLHSKADRERKQWYASRVVMETMCCRVLEQEYMEHHAALQGCGPLGGSKVPEGLEGFLWLPERLFHWGDVAGALTHLLTAEVAIARYLGFVAVVELDKVQVLIREFCSDGASSDFCVHVLSKRTHASCCKRKNH
eukprot:gnl/MRDRNA2_/MRDRNA2_155676_c0_seq1.p1 gnl/MRDRNA2_/MRDRNA2_155676_c0~~gnl/MRDRNA2_/MRDRNA2_155676_c0_seq1.p1  ORF type:complete len:575 (+),score=85.43 gnl/MRDRNA2_/MRDRNA2_155676_c0_seq1:235-1725(+)